MKAHLKWGIVATGGIATDFAQALSASSRCSVVDVAGTSAAKAAAFAQRWSLPRSSSSLSDMLSNPDVDAVYIASPHPSHAEQAVQCWEAGKAVLCEKPLTLTAESAERVIAVAKERKVPLIEAFMYRCHPLTRALIERLRAGAIGRVLKVKADFCFKVERSPDHRLFSPRLGGGGILDVGGYPASFARLVAGVANGGELEEPISVEGRGTIGPTGVDESASATLKFASGVEAELRCAVHDPLGTETVITGERGKIVLADPWIPRGQRQGLDSEFTIYAEGKAPEVVSVHTTLATYAIEAEMIADTLPDLEARWPAMSWADTVGNMRVLDAWLRDVRKAR